MHRLWCLCPCVSSESDLCRLRTPHGMEGVCRHRCALVSRQRGGPRPSCGDESRQLEIPIAERRGYEGRSRHKEREAWFVYDTSMSQSYGVFVCLPSSPYRARTCERTGRVACPTHVLH